MRKALAALILVVLFVVPFSAAAAATKDYRAERFDVDLTILPGGEMDVTETIAFRFDGGPFTYVFRELALSELDAITGISASMDGAQMPQGDQPGQVEIQPGNPIQVRWHFAPTADATHIFTLRYHVVGIVRPAGIADTIIWKAVPEEHEYEIDRVTLRVSDPAGISPLEAPVLEPVPSERLEDASGSTLITGPIGSDEEVRVTLRYPSGTLGAAIPHWQAAQTERSQRIGQVLPYGVAAGLALLAAGLVVLQLNGALSVISQQIESPIPTTIPVQRPPRDLPPAIAGMLASRASQPTWNQGQATLFDLVRRGVITIEELPAPIRWMKPQFEMTLQPTGESLAAHEQALIELIFQSRETPQPGVGLSNLQSAVAQRWPRYTQALLDEMQSSGLIDPERLAARRRWMGIVGVVSALAGFFFVDTIAAFAFLASNARWEWLLPCALAMGVTFGGLLLGLVGLVIVSAYSPYTLQGSQWAAQWKKFALYLLAVIRGKHPGLSANLFEPYLLYAASFGFIDGWVKYFRRLGTASVPTWFHRIASQDTTQDWGAFAAMVAITSTSSSDGGAGSSGGSGGGASGAG